ncbi:MFS transporter [Agrobacterium bohemicum]|nr:MFS transporter [Agrobacterium bohemicum]
MSALQRLIFHVAACLDTCVFHTKSEPLMTHEADVPRPAGKKLQSLFPIFAIVVVDTASAGLILPLLPFYAQDFGATPLTIGFLFASFAICEFLAGPILGNASDRSGRKRLLLISQIGTCASFLLLAVSPNLFVVFLARILGGLSAGNVAIAIAYVADRSEAKVRRQAIGFVSAAMGLGTMVGPALGGTLAPFGLAIPFLVAAGLSLASIVATSTLLPADDRASRIRFDSHVFRKRKRLANQARCAKEVLKNNANGAAKFSLTKLYREITDLIALPNAKALLTALAILYLAFSLFASQLALVLQARYQWDGEPFGPTEIGLLFTVAGATNILVQVVVVRAIRKTFHERTLAAASFALLAVGFALIGFGDTIAGLAVGVFTAASGLALARPTLVAALTLIVPAGSQGVAMGMAQSLASLINIIGPIAGGFLIKQQNYIGWASVLVALALTGLAAVGLLSLFPEKSDPTER